MIEELIEQTIAAAQQEKASRVKEASDQAERLEAEKSPIAFSLRKLADELRKEGTLTPEDGVKETNTKLAEAADNALKRLTLIQRFTRGDYAV